MFIKGNPNEREIDIPWMPPCPMCGAKLIIEIESEGTIKKAKGGGATVSIKPVILCPSDCLLDLGQSSYLDGLRQRLLQLVLRGDGRPPLDQRDLLDSGLPVGSGSNDSLLPEVPWPVSRQSLTRGS